MNYYQILGVQPDADIIVIKAAYKALARKFHPDSSNLPKEKSLERMKEINKAYETLSDSLKRKQYDENLSNDTFDQNDNYRDFKDAFDDYIEDKWKFALEYFPHLNKQYDSLTKISFSLAEGFRFEILATESYKNSETLRKKMKLSYFVRYFGNDSKAHRFAEKLLLSNQRAAAKELNKAICQFGSNISTTELINKICIKYKLNYSEKAKQQGENSNKPQSNSKKCEPQDSPTKHSKAGYNHTDYYGRPKEKKPDEILDIPSEKGEIKTSSNTETMFIEKLFIWGVVILPTFAVLFGGILSSCSSD